LELNTQILTSINTSPELIVLIAGFEKRCLSILRYINGINLRNSHIILLVYIKQEDMEVNLANEDSEKVIISFLKNRKLNFETIPLDHLNPLRTIVDLKNYISRNKLDPSKEIIIDISSAKDSLITLLTIQLLKNKFQHIKFIYTMPKSYNLVEIAKKFKDLDKFTQEIINKRFQRISKFIKVAPFKGFEGIPDPTIPSRFIFLVGLDVNKVLVVCREFEDSWVTTKKILVGSSAFVDNSEIRDFTREIHSRLTKRYEMDYSLIENHNLQEIISSLNKIINPFLNKENIILCCFGTKIQMLACTLFSYMNPRITLLKVQMKQYRPKYFSKGIGKSLIIDIST